MKLINVDGDNTRELVQFAQRTAGGSAIRTSVPVPTPHVRVDWEIGGTAPSSTFSASLQVWR